MRARPPALTLAMLVTPVALVTPVTLVTLALTACGAGPTPTLAGSPRSGLPIERLFPLVNGYVYSYELMGDSGNAGVLITRVVRTSPTNGELRSGASSKRFEYRQDGVVSATTGTFVLKLPLEVGASWRGEHGGVTRVVSIDAAPIVPAGRFTGCVQTVEERRGDRPLRYTTTFCADVGVVAIEAQGGMDLERAELKSYAPPVEIGPDAVIMTKPGEGGSQ